MFVAFVDPKIIDLKKSQNFHFSKGEFSVKNCDFSHSFLLVKICQIKLFGAVLRRAIGFLDHKNID